MRNNIQNQINIEKTVLSSIFFDYENIYIAQEILTPKDFYHIAHQEIYSAMLELHKNDMPIDEDFIKKKAKNINDNILLDIFSCSPISNVKAYVKEIKENSTKRELLSFATKVNQIANDDSLSINEVLSNVENEFYQVTDNSATSKSKTLEQIVQNFKLRHEQASSQKGKDRYIFTGIASFDNKFGGFEPGKIVVIGARPSMGKSSLAFQIALNSIKRKKGVLINSLEMSSEDVIMRMVAQENQESISDLLAGLVKNVENFHKTLNYLSTNSYLHIDDRVLSFNQLKSNFLKVKRDRAKKGLSTDLWIIDHIGFVQMNPKNKRYEEIGYGSKILQALAKEQGITILVLSQLNRAVTDRKGSLKNRPQLSDLKDSGSLEEDADIVLFPHRDSYYEKAEKNEIEADVNRANILLLKNRNGRTGVITCDFKGSTNSFGSFPLIEIVYNQTKSNDEVQLPYIDM